MRSCEIPNLKDELVQMGQDCGVQQQWTIMLVENVEQTNKHTNTQCA